jgi:hypothetical protein
MDNYHLPDLHDHAEGSVSAKAVMRDTLTYGTNYNGWVECKQANSRDKLKTCDYGLLHQAALFEKRENPNFAKEWLTNISGPSPALSKHSEETIFMQSFMNTK